MPRPRLNPTEDQRKLVKSMAAMGTPQEHIALKVGIRSPKTLRKYFRTELDFGLIEAAYKVKTTLFQMATSGKHFAATQFWLKTHQRFCSDFPSGGKPVAPPAFVVTQDSGALND